MDNSVKERTIEFIKYKGITMKSFENSCGLSSGYVTSMRKGFGIDKLNNVLNAYPELSRDWLLYGEGEMIKTDTQDKYQLVSGRPYYNVDFECGFDELINDQTIIPAYTISYPPYNKEGVIWCNATGQSMIPEINPGDIIAIQEIINWKDYITYGETYAIITANNLRTIKKIRKGSTNNTLLLVPINQDGYDKQEINKEQILRIYRVLAVIKKF